MELISKLNPITSNGNRNQEGREDQFIYNKDADMLVCPAGHLAQRKAKTDKKRNTNKNQKLTYYFDVEKCKVCSMKQGCYKESAKTKTYSITIKSALHQNQKSFEESEYFKARYRERYKIEAKNSELKNQHGYDVAYSTGLFGMRIQGAVSIFTVNIKRILTILRELE